MVAGIERGWMESCYFPTARAYLHLTISIGAMIARCIVIIAGICSRGEVGYNAVFLCGETMSVCAGASRIQ